MALEFEWDPHKAEENRKKHKVSFEEAKSAFWDALSLTIPDPAHSKGEERHILLGHSLRERLLYVVHQDRGNRIRIISARLATLREKKDYAEKK